MKVFIFCVFLPLFVTGLLAATTASAPKVTVDFHAHPINCYECHYGGSGEWHNSVCPKNGTINGWALNPRICPGPCVSVYTTYPDGDVFRACSLNYFFTFERPMDGCYSFQQDIYCFCSYSFCNNQDMTIPFDVTEIV